MGKLIKNNNKTTKFECGKVRWKTKWLKTSDLFHYARCSNFPKTFPVCFFFFFLVHSKIGKPIFFSNITPFRSWKFFQQSLKRSSFVQYPSKLKNVNSWTKYLWTFSFPFTASITELGYYHQKVNIRVASRVAERLKKWS